MQAEVDSRGFGKVVKMLHEMGNKMDIGEGHVALITADASLGGTTIEIASKGFYSRVLLPGAVQQPGYVAIASEYLERIKMLGKTTKFSMAESGRLKFSSGRTRGEVDVFIDPGVIASQRPVTTEFSGQVLIDGKLLASMLKAVLFKPSVQSKLQVRIQVYAEGMTITAHDSYRATQATWAAPQQGQFDITLSAKMLSDVVGPLTTASDNVYIMAAGELCRLVDETGRVDVWTPVIRRPDVVDLGNYVGSQMGSASFSFDAAEAAKAAKAVGGISGKGTKEPRISVAVGGEEMLFRVEDKAGVCENSIDIEWHNAASVFEMTLMSSHLEEFLRCLRALFKKVQLTFYAGKFVVLSGSSDDGSATAMYVIPLPQTT